MQRDLVERARRGDHDAFAELAGAAISRLDGAAWLMLRDIEQAKDAVQDTLVRAWRDLPTLRDPDRFDAWLHRLLVHACIDEARRLRRHRLDVELTTIAIPSAVDDVSVGRRPRPARTRLPPTRSGDAGRDRPSSLPRPSDAGRRGDPRDPPGDRQVAVAPRPRRDARGTRCRLRVRGANSWRAGRHDRQRPPRPLAVVLAPRGRGVPRARPPRRGARVTRETRQRPAWSSLERWLPVDTTFRPRLFSVPRAGRLLLVAALILLVLRDRDPRGRLRPTAAAGAVRTGPQRAHRHEQ